MRLTELENRVRHVEWPEPPATLRARVLNESALVGPSITWSDRVWYSRVWRVSMAAAALIFISLNMLSNSARSSDLMMTSQTTAEARAIEETGRQIGLPADVSVSLARRVQSESGTSEIDRHAALAALEGDRR